MRGMAQSGPQGPSQYPDRADPHSAYARARVSVGVGVGVGHVLEGEASGDRDARAGARRGSYPWPPVSPEEIRELVRAYEALTSRRVWDSMMSLLIVCRRYHGPDTIPLLRELYAEHGVHDLLLRLRDHPARLAADLIRAEPAPQETGAAAAAPARRVADKSVRAHPVSAPAGPVPSAGVTGLSNVGGVPGTHDAFGPADMRAPWTREEIDDALRDVPLPEPRGDARCEPDRAPRVETHPRSTSTTDTHGPVVTNAAPVPCTYERHRPTWVPRRDGSLWCQTCHP